MTDKLPPGAEEITVVYIKADPETMAAQEAHALEFLRERVRVGEFVEIDGRFYVLDPPVSGGSEWARVRFEHRKTS